MNSLPRSWFAIEDSVQKQIFAEELTDEFGVGHPLKSVSALPIARADGRDDYLFAPPHGRIAEVRLTVANRP